MGPGHRGADGQAQPAAAGAAVAGTPVYSPFEGKTELDAIIAYLQGMGTAIKTRR